MILTNEARFAINDLPVELVLITTETGEVLEGVHRLDTNTGEFHKYVLDGKGAPMVDAFGVPITVKGRAIQFYFTLTAGPRSDFQPTDVQVGAEANH